MPDASLNGEGIGVLSLLFSIMSFSASRIWHLRQSSEFCEIIADCLVDHAQRLDLIFGGDLANDEINRTWQSQGKGA